MSQGLQFELASLQARVETLERERAAGRTRVKRVVGIAGVMLALGGSVAWAASGACPNGYPFCFVADQPAVASAVNHNFAQVKEWVEAKVGPVAAGAASSAPATMSSASFGNTTRQMVNLYDANYGIGVQASTAYFRTGGGYAWYLNGTHNNAQNNAGTGGTSLMTLDSAGTLTTGALSTGSITATTVNGRRPAYVVTNNCNSANCTANCGAGVVKSGWGIHGATSGTNVAVWGGTCGNAASWMGACIGQNSCTLTTGCGSSALWLECW